MLRGTKVPEVDIFECVVLIVRKVAKVVIMPIRRVRYRGTMFE